MAPEVAIYCGVCRRGRDSASCGSPIIGGEKRGFADGRPYIGQLQSSLAFSRRVEDILQESAIEGMMEGAEGMGEGKRELNKNQIKV